MLLYIYFFSVSSHPHFVSGEQEADIEAVLPHSTRHFGRATIMPNLKPPVTTTARAMEYREEMMRALPPGTSFLPLMTLYLTDNTSPEEIKRARESGVVFAAKLYPAGATTNSQDGVAVCLPVLEEMVRQQMPLLVHGEVTDPHVDIFDHEKVFIDRILAPLVQKLLQLKIVMQHITAMDAVFIESCEQGIYSASVALSLYAKIFEEAGALDNLDAFTSFNGPDFYGLPRNT